MGPQQVEKSKVKIPSNINSNLILGSLATLIAITPYIFYSYERVLRPKRSGTLFCLHIEAGYYASALEAFWTMMGKFIPFYKSTIILYL